MKAFGIYIRGLVIFLLGATLINITYNYFIDPYGIFQNRKSFIGLEPNQHSLKINHLKKREEPVKLIFSNSRGGVLNFTKKDSSWYNMSYSLGTPEEFLKDLKILTKDIAIDEIVVFLDASTLFEDASTHNRQLLRKFKDLENDHKFEFLFAPISTEILFNYVKYNSFLFNQNNTKYLEFDVSNTGSYIEHNFEYCTQELELREVALEDPKEYMELFHQKLKVFSEIKAICEKNNIALKLMAHPISSKMYELDRSRISASFNFIEFLKENNFTVKTILDKKIIEFSDCQWRDVSHYNRVIADIVEEHFLQTP